MTVKKSKLLKDLEELLNDITIDPTLFPYQKGNSIRIGQYVVRPSKRGGYSVYDCKSNARVAETFSKASALALAKSMAKGYNEKDYIMDIDLEIQKWYNDCVFYKHNMKKTKDLDRWDILSTRYEIAKDRTEHAKQQLDKIIFR